MLKVLARITTPTDGEVYLRGKVGSLLEVGTGFHPELTGRENIYMNGAILGMKKADIDERFDDIVSFSEIGQFLDTPVKRYSSGMYVRLAFSVASSMAPEVLLVDEVLAVGDAKFKDKCLARMNDLINSGVTFIFVSHSMEQVKRICKRTIVFDHGSIAYDGDVVRGIEEYNRLGR
jgi:lipopolysaccharide transport system ATP-binding protein